MDAKRIARVLAFVGILVVVSIFLVTLSAITTKYKQSGVVIFASTYNGKPGNTAYDDSSQGGFLREYMGLAQNLTRNRCDSTFLDCNPNLCKTLPPDGAVLYVYSGRHDRAGRDVIRATFASDSLSHKIGIRRFFVLGKSQTNESIDLSKSLREEMVRHRDLVIGDFIDTYQNLTLKGTTALEYISKYCSNAKWVIKMDSDVIADTPNVMEYLRHHEQMQERALVGRMMMGAAPFICPTMKKWCINRWEFPLLRRYPTYVLGWGYAFTTDLVTSMLREADKTVRYRKIADDVYMTGYLTKNLKIKFVNAGSHAKAYWDLKKTNKSMRDDRVLFLHLESDYSIHLIQSIWQQLLEAEKNGSRLWTQKKESVD